MSADLIRRMLAARESKVPLGEDGRRVLTVRRPDNLQLSRWSGRLGESILLECVVGWEGFTEQDFDPNATDDLVEFDAPLYRLWIADHQEYWDTIIDPVLDELKRRRMLKEEAEGNSGPSSSGKGTSRKAKQQLTTPPASA